MATNTGKPIDPEVARVKRVVLTVILLVILLVAIIGVFSSFYTIQSGNEGVLLTFNRADPIAKEPGLHMKVPFVQRIVKFDMRTQKYGISALSGSQGGTGGSLESASSSDLQIVSLQMVVNYRLSAGQAPTIFTKIGAGYEDNVISPAVHEATKAAVAQFTAAELIGKREAVRASIENLLKENLKKYNIIVEQVSIVNLDFSAQFNQAIEQKVTAEQLKQKAENDLARIKVEADQLRAQANGQSDAKIALATAEARQIQLVQEQLKQSPQYVEYIRANRWNGAYPQFYSAGTGSNFLFQLPLMSNGTS